MSFQAKIKLGLGKSGPLSHTGFKNRTIKKGESFVTTSPEEAAYYRSQPGFAVTVVKGKLPLQSAQEVDPEDDVIVGPDLDDEPDDEEEPVVLEEAVAGTYERADLRKMSRDDLRLLIKTDNDLPLTLKQVPKTASKREIVGLIMDAQANAVRSAARNKDRAY